MPDDAAPKELHPSEIARNEAEAARHKAEARKLEAEADEAEANAESARIDLDRERRKREKELAAHEHFYFYPFKSDVSSASVSACIDALTMWMRTADEGTPFEVQFNSPGGSVIDGMALWDFLQLVRTRHPLTTSTIGYAASMAGILLQAGDKRVMGRQSWLMIHEASFSTAGKTGEVEDRVEWIKAIQKRILAIFAERSKLSVAQLDRRWKRKDWWICAEDGLRFGLVDEIR